MIKNVTFYSLNTFIFIFWSYFYHTWLIARLCAPSHSRSIHSNFSFWVHVYTQRELLVFIIEYSVKVLQELLTKDEVLIVEFIQFVFSYGKLALVLVLVKVFRRIYLKDSFSTNLAATSYQESNRLQQFFDFITFMQTLAEVRVGGAIQVFDSFFPCRL